MEKSSRSCLLTVIITASVLILLFNAGNIIESINNSIEYSDGLKYIEQGQYDLAEEMFSDKYEYKNGLYLYYFSMYMQQKDSGNGGYYYISSIPQNYSGEFADIIKRERSEAMVRHESYIEEKAKLKEEERKSYHDKLPFKGMSAEFINDTLVGKYDKVIKGTGYADGESFTKRTYQWYSDDGRDVVLTVVVRETDYRAYVTDVIKWYEDVYWTASGKPNFGAKRPTTQTTAKKKKEYPDDDYNVFDYYDPEDFYYDYEDDFWDYEDAEDYFYDMWEGVE